MRVLGIRIYRCGRKLNKIWIYRCGSGQNLRVLEIRIYRRWRELTMRARAIEMLLKI